jgi:hypothetical protein
MELMQRWIIGYKGEAGYNNARNVAGSGSVCRKRTEQQNGECKVKIYSIGKIIYLYLISSFWVIFSAISGQLLSQ